jgi:ribonuclease D
VLERSTDDILAMVERGLAVSEEERPQRLHTTHRPNQTEKLMVKVLDACLKTLCTREKLPASFVMSRSELERMVRLYRRGGVYPEENGLLQGWRNDLVGRELLAVLEGRVSIALDPRTGEVRLLPVTL